MIVVRELSEGHIVAYATPTADVDAILDALIAATGPGWELHPPVRLSPAWDAYHANVHGAC